MILTAEMAPRPADGGGFELHIAVTDTGIGISPRRPWARMFQSFSQADAATSRKYGGTGLGLAISKRLAEAMGGTMWVESAGPGRAARSISRSPPRGCATRLPSTGGPGPGSSTSIPSTPPTTRCGSCWPRTTGQPEARASGCSARMGYVADMAGNGIEAIDAVGRQRYDLVLMDVQMPEMDGLEATAHRRARACPTGRWIVAMTANAMDGDRERCIEAGMNGYISKPIRVEELVAALLGTPTE